MPRRELNQVLLVRPLLVLVSASILGTFLSGCAPRSAPPPRVVAPRYPEFIFPAVPSGLAGATVAAGGHQRAWQFLQAGDLGAAEREFAAVLKRAPTFYPSETGLGYVELARREYQNAATRFDRALSRSSGYAPALVGRGDALLGSSRQGEALESFEAALAVDPSLGDVRQRVEVLKFRSVEDSVAAARRAGEAGRYEEARQAYERAIAASPESAFLFRDLAAVELRQGEPDRALEHARKARDLDPADARTFALLGEIYDRRGEFDAAVAAYTSALGLDPGAVREERIVRSRERAELARLPQEYRAIGAASQVSRGELAALVGVRLAGLLRVAGRRDAALITDTRGHWATEWIRAVALAGVMEVYADHTFQPRATIRRGELGQVASRALNLISMVDPALAKQWQGARRKFSDLGPGHLSYPAASLAVAAGVLPVLDGDTFQLTRPVSGPEAVAAVDRLAELSTKALAGR